MIDRETIIERSIDAYLREQLFGARGYPVDKVEILDAYPTNERMSRPLDKNYVAIGWSTDDGGRQAELGSSLKRRLYTFDFYVFGTSRVWAKNLASVIRFALEADENIPVLDPRDGTTAIDSVAVEFVSTQQVVVRTPRAYEENVWVTRLRVEDYYSSSGGG